MYLSELPNLQTKLMVYTQFGPSFDQLYYSTDVYRLQETFAVEDFNNESISITPNPAISEINFTTNNTIVEASICSITGELLQFNASNAITKMNVQQLQTGIYFLHLVDSNHIQSTKKIIISH
jgi:subtilase family serine protease